MWFLSYQIVLDHLARDLPHGHDRVRLPQRLLELRPLREVPQHPHHRAHRGPVRQLLQLLGTRHAVVQLPQQHLQPALGQELLLGSHCQGLEVTVIVFGSLVFVGSYVIAALGDVLECHCSLLQEGAVRSVAADGVEEGLDAVGLAELK